MKKINYIVLTKAIPKQAGIFMLATTNEDKRVIKVNTVAVFNGTVNNYTNLPSDPINTILLYKGETKQIVWSRPFHEKVDPPWKDRNQYFLWGQESNSGTWLTFIKADTYIEEEVKVLGRQIPILEENKIEHFDKILTRLELAEEELLNPLGIDPKELSLVEKTTSVFREKLRSLRGEESSQETSPTAVQTNGILT